MPPGRPDITMQTRGTFQWCARDASRLAWRVALSGVTRSLLLKVMRHTVTARAYNPAHLSGFVGLSGAAGPSLLIASLAAGFRPNRLYSVGFLVPSAVSRARRLVRDLGRTGERIEGGGLCHNYFPGKIWRLFRVRVFTVTRLALMISMVTSAARVPFGFHQTPQSGAIWQTARDRDETARRSVLDFPCNRSRTDDVKSVGGPQCSRSETGSQSLAWPSMQNASPTIALIFQSFPT